MARLNDPPAPPAPPAAVAAAATAVPPPAESVEALKRRFVRQNRELTKANTSQSLRIRTLELETSRLLAENLSLRAEIIRLQHENHRRETQRAAVRAVRERFEAKLGELGDLLGELDEAQEMPVHRRRTPARGQVVEEEQQEEDEGSPDRKEWKNALDMEDVAAAATAGGTAAGQQEGKLPMILEDKCWPRRTMNADELRGLLSMSGNPAADSPDLGPPPVAHFDAEDPIKFDADKRTAAEEGHEPRGPVFDDTDEGLTILSANLETRKKRRSHSAPFQPDVLQKEETATVDEAKADSPGTDSRPAGEALNPSSKRKLSVRDDEEPAGQPETLVGDEAKENREQARIVNGSTEKQKSLRVKQEKPRKTKTKANPLAAVENVRDESKDDSVVTVAATRKALEPKSTNTGTSSPTKSNRAIGKDTVLDSKKDPKKKPRDKSHDRDRDRDRSKDRKPASHNESTTSSTKPPEPRPEVAQLPAPPAPEPVELPPETPAAGLDLFSPQSSEQSAARPESRDTPPPSDLEPSSASSAASADAFAPAGRPSRRARPGVSYAEPNLRDKMRRPTKALADAVGADEKILRAAGVKPEHASVSGGSRPSSAEPAAVAVKTEPASDPSAPSWADVPSESSRRQKYRAGATSPLGDKSAPLDGGEELLPPSVLTQRKTRRSSSVYRMPEDGVGGEECLQSSAASSSAGRSVTALVAAGAATQEKAGPDHAEKELATESAVEKLDVYEFDGSSPRHGHDEGAEDVGASGPPSRSSRRHTSVPTSLRQVAQAQAQVRKEQVATEDVPASRSRSSSRSSNRRRGTLGLDGALDMPVPSAKDEGGILGSEHGAVGAKSDVNAALRAERMAVRRRSMML